MQRSPSSRWCASALIAAMVLAGRSCAAKTSAAAGGDAAPTHAGLGPSSLYFRQLCPGDEIATSGSELHAMARSMNNFIYVIGDRDTREAVVIDACWDVEGVVEAVRADGMNITKAFATHYHFDHIGGLRGGIRFFSAQPRPVLRNLAPALCLSPSGSLALWLSDSLMPTQNPWDQRAVRNGHCCERALVGDR